MSPSPLAALLGEILAQPLVVAASLRRYRLSRNGTLETARGKMVERQGLILTLFDEQGLCAEGEAAPWPPFSSDSLSDVDAALTATAERLVSPIREAKGRPAHRWTDTLPPCAAHAVEQAVLSLYAKRKARPPWQLLGGNTQTIPIRELLDDRDTPKRHSPARPEGQVDVELSDVGSSPPLSVVGVKVKVGAGAIKDDLMRLERVRRRYPRPAQIWLDANQAWGTVDEALGALAQYRPFGIAGMEQPLGRLQLDEHRELRALSSIPITLDESVRDEADLEAVIRAGSADGVVIKPMFVGGIRRALELGCRSIEAGLRVSVTHSLESSIGRRTALWVASAMPRDALWPCGLTVPFDETLSWAGEERVFGSKACLDGSGQPKRQVYM